MIHHSSHAVYVAYNYSLPLEYYGEIGGAAWPVRIEDEFYRHSFVVFPVHDLVYSAGATASIGAGSMARAVIAFRSRGVMDYIIDGETGILVEPGNVQGIADVLVQG